MSADAKYEEMYKALKEEAENAMMSKSIDDTLDEFKKAVKDKTTEIHSQIDDAIDELIKAGEEAFCSKTETTKETTTDKKEVDEKEKEREKKLLEKKQKDREAYENKLASLKKFDESLPFDIKSKQLTELISFLNKEQGGKNRLVSRIVQAKEDPYREIKYNKEGKMEMKILSYAKVLGSGKNSTELAWRKNQNQPQCSNINKEDDTELEVHGTCCYNWYRTDKEFTADENVYAVFESTVSNNDDHFYFGVANESLIPSSNCGCCTISQACYIYHSGNICVHGSFRNETGMEFKSKNGQPTLLAIRVMGTTKEVFFTVDDREEKGPYKLNGQKFNIVFGSCNTANGKIKILNSYYI